MLNDEVCDAVYARTKKLGGGAERLLHVGGRRRDGRALHLVIA
jgi:hypothetical protein